MYEELAARALVVRRLKKKNAAAKARRAPTMRLLDCVLGLMERVLGFGLRCDCDACYGAVAQVASSI